MQENDQRLRQAIRVGNIGIFDHDHESGDIYWSPELRGLYGWDAEEPATLPKIISHVHPDDAARVIAAVRRAHDPNGDGLFDIEHRITDRRGQLRWVLTRSQTHFETVAGELRAMRTIGAVQDMTERRSAEERLRVLDAEHRRLEAQLVQVQKMESLGRVAGGIAHDFNNLLTVILGGIELGLHGLPPEHASRICLNDAAHAAQSAAELTRQLLAFARKEPIAPKVLDLNEVIARAKKMIERLIGKHIRLETNGTSDLMPIWCDPAQVEQIILNLAVNARDAMSGGGRITIEASNAIIDEPHAKEHIDARPGTYVMLAVSDNGVGMTDEVRAHLFEPFFTTKEAGKGTGLGLATVYGTVRQNGGWIEVDSQPERGSAFRVYLPVAGGERPERQASYS
jgi:PAS domain S-box-containing protein